MKLTIICLAAGVFYVNGFVSPLRILVSIEAFTSSLTSGLNKEIASEDIIINSIFKSHFHPELDLLYTGLLGLSLVNKLGNNVTETENRWSTITIYNTISKHTRIVLFIIMIVFTKNIENAI